MTRMAMRLAFSCFVLFYLVMFALGQEVEGRGKNAGALFAPADYLEISVPVTERVGLNVYGFYLGNLQASIGLLEVPLNLTHHISLTPSYLFINVPANGLGLLTGQQDARSYKESQFRTAITATTSWHGFLLADRNMYVGRFVTPSRIDRYRNRLYVARALSLRSFRLSPFCFDEIYHDFAPGNWLRRNWIVGGVDTPVNGNLTVQISYIHQDDQYLRSVNFLGIGIIIRARGGHRVGAGG